MDIIGNVPIYWINLNRAEKRRKFMEDQFSEHKLVNVKRIEAVDGNNLDQIYLKKHKRFYKNNQQLNKYEKACTLSHIKAIQCAYDDNLDYVIVMEDDCCFRYINFQTIPIIDLMSNNNDIELIQLMTICDVNESTNLAQSKNMIEKGYHASAGAYIISKIGMMKILQAKPSELLSEADHYLYYNLNTYHVTKPYFRDNISYETQLRLGIEKKKDFNLHLQNIKFWDNYYKLRR